MRTLVIDQNIYNGAEFYAKTHNISVKDFIESIILKTLSLDNASKKRQSHAWRDYSLSSEVMAMTFDERKDLGDNYEEDYAKYLIEKTR